MQGWQEVSPPAERRENTVSTSFSAAQRIAEYLFNLINPFPLFGTAATYVIETNFVMC